MLQTERDQKFAAPMKPVPVPDDLTAPFWTGAAEHRLVIQRCLACGKFNHVPVPVCLYCHKTPSNWSYEAVSGRARIKTWTVFRQSFLPSFAKDLPYVVVEAAIEEQDDIWVLGRLVDGPNAKLAVGMPVETVFEDVKPGLSIPHFKLVGAGR